MSRDVTTNLKMERTKAQRAMYPDLLANRYLL